MKKVFDLIEAINEEVMAYSEENGKAPREISISRDAYRRLLKIKSEENVIGNLVIGCAPITEIETETGTIRLVIDEMLAETDIVVS